MQVIDWLAKRALYHPDKVGLIDAASGCRFTYAEMNEQANRAANYLAALGVRAGDRVGMLAPNCAEVVWLFFGSTKLGAIFLPLNSRLAPPELEPIVAQAEPKVVLRGESFERYCGEYRACSPERTEPIPVDDESPQMLLFTSGTTGKPKGAVLSHRMILWNCVNFALRDLLPSDTVLVHSPMFYTAGLNVYTMPAFFLGGTVVLMPGWDTEGALRLIERERVTVFFAVPTQLLMLAESPLWKQADLSSLRYVISGGAACPARLIHRILERGLTYKQGMGLTEVGPNCFCLEARDALRKAGSIGYPNFAIEARIVDEDGRELGADEVGELLLRTPAMCSGYWQNPEATAAAIRDGWFYTGDLARRDVEGFYYIVDRKKDMFISGGENVYPAEIENVLATHPAIDQVAVIGVPHEKWGEVGCACVVLRPDTSAAAEEILAYCQGKLARFKIPKSVVFCDSLPRTHSGKVRKSELAERVQVAAQRFA